MKKILVTGCNGQLGRAINKVYVGDAVEFINTDVMNSDTSVALDISNLEEVVKLVEETQPEIIINCAAYTAVDACEQNWELAYRINAIGPRNLSIAANKVGAKLIHVSTDYVFAGDGEKPYTEFDEVSPKSAYGKTKLEGERFVEKFARKYFIVRTAWLYGEGKNFVKTMLRLSETNEEISVVNDQIGSPTSAMELARMIRHIEPTENYGLFHGTCEELCSWADFTREIFRLTQKSTKVKNITSEEYAAMYPAAAKRPAYSVLDNYMLHLTTDYKMADWKTAIAEYIESGLYK